MDALRSGLRKDPPPCPKAAPTDRCDRLSRKGLVWRPRLKLGFGETSAPVAMQLWRCASHGYFREYPPFIVPRKHYATHVVAGALDGRSEGRSVEQVCNEQGLEDTSVVRRWMVQIMWRLDEAVTSPVLRWFALARQWQMPSGPFTAVWTSLDLLYLTTHELQDRYPTRIHFALSL